MLKESLIPTPLILDEGRDAIQTVEVTRPGWATFFGSVVVFLRAGLLLLGLRFRRGDELAKARRLRQFIERHGGLWFKIGQILAVRRDILPAAYCDELAKLHDRATAFPFAQCRQIVEEELGQPLEAIFSEFNPVAVAAASIGQIHQAVLRTTGDQVAVKIRRPYVEAMFRRDLALLRVVVSLMDRLAATQYLRWGEMFAELEIMLNEELDFRIEAGSIVRMRRSLKPHKIYVPYVFLRYCTCQVLVMEWIDGVPMTDYLHVYRTNPPQLEAWLLVNDIVPTKVASRLFMTVQRQIFEDNLFHADLHPGNILLLRNSRLALIDFGAIGSLENSFRQRLILYNQLTLEGEHAKATGLLLRLSAPLPRVDMHRLIRELVRSQQHSRMIMASPAFSYAEKMAHEATAQQARIMGAHKIPLSWDYLRIHRSHLSMQMSLRYLNPNIDLEKLVRKYAREAAARGMATSTEQLGGNLLRLFNDVRGVQNQVARSLILQADPAMDLMGLRSRALKVTSEVFRLLDHLLIILILLLLLIFVYQHLRFLLPSPIALQLSQLEGFFPVLGYLGWLVVFVVALYVRATLRRIRDYLVD